MSKENFVSLLERHELIQKLIDAGYGDLIDALLSNENKVYTKKGRLNKCGLCRVLNCKSKQIEDAFKAMREILKDSMED